MSDDPQARGARLTPQERKARDALRRIDADAAIREHEDARNAFFENRERLRALRLEREKQQPEPHSRPAVERDEPHGSIEGSVRSTKDSMAKKAHTSRGLKQDRVEVASGQKHEVRYGAKKTGPRFPQ
jgi:hypothetical protein